MDNNIKSIVSGLSPDFLETLQVCCLLCNSGIEVVDLHEVTQIGSPQTFNKLLKSLADDGLVLENGSTIYSLKEISEVVLSKYSITEEMLDRIVSNLLAHLYYSPYCDQLKEKGYYSMAEEVVSYIVNNSVQAEVINIVKFSELLFKMCELYCVYGRSESVLRPEDLTIMKALEIVRGKVEEGSLIYSSILLCQSYFYICGFYYSEARIRIDEAANIIKADESTIETAVLAFIEALYHENYGDILKSLAYLYDAYHMTVECGFEDQRCLIAMYLSYQLALCEDQESYQWNNKVNIFSFASNNVIQFYFHLSNTLRVPNCGYYTANELSMAEQNLTAINVDSPLLARLYYVRAITTSQARRSNNFYKLYAQHISKIYCSSSAAMKIFYAQEVVRFCKQGLLLMAKHLVIEQLDCINILSSEISCSTRLEVLGAYAEYHLADDKYAMLADAYIDQALEILQALNPSQEMLQKLSNVFSDETIPASLLENITWYFNIRKIEALIGIFKNETPVVLEANGYKDISKDIKERVKNLTKQFPYRRSEIEVIEAYVLSISDPYKACQKWARIIKNASYSTELTVALSAGRYSRKIGFIYQSMEYYHTVVSCKSFNELHTETQSILLQEYAAILEECRNSKAWDIWDQALKLTKDPESKAKIYLSQAISHYERGQYQMALMKLELALCNHEREELYDEFLAKLYGWEANTFCRLHRFFEAKEAVSKGLNICPPCYKESLEFDLNFTYSYVLMATEDYSTARTVLKKTKELASNKKQKDQIDSLYEIINLPYNERKKHFMHH